MQAWSSFGKFESTSLSRVNPSDDLDLTRRRWLIRSGIPMLSGQDKIFRLQRGIQSWARQLMTAELMKSSRRLHLQHWIWNYQLGYALHPGIDTSSSSPLRVADVAAGNG
jgi:hypothetical protein